MFSVCADFVSCVWNSCAGAFDIKTSPWDVLHKNIVERVPANVTRSGKMATPLRALLHDFWAMDTSFIRRLTFFNAPVVEGRETFVLQSRLRTRSTIVKVEVQTVCESYSKAITITNRSTVVKGEPQPVCQSCFFVSVSLSSATTSAWTSSGKLPGSWTTVLYRW